MYGTRTRSAGDAALVRTRKPPYSVRSKSAAGTVIVAVTSFACPGRRLTWVAGEPSTVKETLVPGLPVEKNVNGGCDVVAPTVSGLAMGDDALTNERL